MTDLTGIHCISNNLGIYYPDLMQYSYNFRFAGNRNTKNISEELADTQNSIKIMSNEEFERGSVFEITSINPHNNTIYVTTKKDVAPTGTMPILTCLSMRIGVDEGASYTFTPGQGIEIIHVAESVCNRSKFYGLVVLIDTVKSSIFGTDLVSGSKIEWVLTNYLEECLQGQDAA